jgi:hypothetical protein
MMIGTRRDEMMKTWLKKLSDKVHMFPSSTSNVTVIMSEGLNEIIYAYKILTRKPQGTCKTTWD